MTVNRAEEPLIWTTKGNVPIKDLKYQTSWDINEDNIIFAEEYRLNGEIVKRSAHVYSRAGLLADSGLGNMG